MSKRFGVAFLATLVFVFLVLATASGRWTKDRELKDQWEEVGLWADCTCVDINYNQCPKFYNYLHSVQAFSLIETISVFLAVLGLLYEFFLSHGNANVYNFVLLFLLIAVIGNILSWTIFAGFFKKEDICSSGDKSLKQQGFMLSWAFGVRVISLAVIVAVLGITFGNKGKGATRAVTHNAALLVGLFLLLLSVIITSGRGWAWLKDIQSDSEVKGEVGLFDYCTCKQTYYNDCVTARRRLYVAETFSVLAIFFQFVFVALLLHGAAAANQTGQKVVGILSTISQVIVLVVFAQYAKTSYCDLPPVDQNQQLHWAYGISATALIVHVLSYVLLLTTPAEAAAEAETKPNEPTAAPAS